MELSLRNGVTTGAQHRRVEWHAKTNNFVHLTGEQGIAREGVRAFCCNSPVGER